MIAINLVWPVAAAMTAGGLIGVERTYNGHPASFRTHILVCLTSCLLMLAGMHQSTWAFTALPGQNVVIDPTRMSHGLLHNHSVRAKGQMRLDIDSLVARLAQQPGLAGFSVLPRDDWRNE